MRGNKILAVAVLACLAGFAVWAQAPRSPSPQHLLSPVQANPQKNPGPFKKKDAQPPVHRLGAWLEAHKNLPPDQQEKALERDPGFKKLSPDRQAALRERLRNFNSLTPQQRERALQRLNYMAALTPAQRAQIRDSQKQLQTLPEDRKVMIHKALRHLRQMDPQQRNEVMQSDRFKSTFSDQEQGILKQLSAIDPPGEGGAPAAGQQPK